MGYPNLTAPNRELAVSRQSHQWASALNDKKESTLQRITQKMVQIRLSDTPSLLDGPRICPPILPEDSEI